MPVQAAVSAAAAQPYHPTGCFEAYKDAHRAVLAVRRRGAPRTASCARSPLLRAAGGAASCLPEQHSGCCSPTLQCIHTSYRPRPRMATAHLDDGHLPEELVHVLVGGLTPRIPRLHILVGTARPLQLQPGRRTSGVHFRCRRACPDAVALPAFQPPWPPHTLTEISRSFIAPRSALAPAVGRYAVLSDSVRPAALAGLVGRVRHC